MIPTFQFLFVILIYIIEEICCSGPDFSDVRYLANNGYELPSQALYKKIYGGHGKRYGVHFPGPNEGYGLHNAHDKDPGGIDYKEFGWKYKKYIYPKILPQRHHYDGNAVYDDPGRFTGNKKEKPNINLYIYNSEDGSPTNSDDGKYDDTSQKMKRKRRKMKQKSKSQIYKYQDPYDIYEPVGSRNGYADGTESKVADETIENVKENHERVSKDQQVVTEDCN